MGPRGRKDGGGRAAGVRVKGSTVLGLGFKNAGFGD
jgi:hypothetical protein